MTAPPPDQDPRSAQLSALLSGRTPVPTNTRFKPLRMGLLGIWQYADDEFNFHDGRLILRGRNGSGKTKVLEVTSPFLLDANLSTRRLDPFGGDARSMRDNLLYGGRSHQIGYVWCEYGRITEDGSAEYRTIGAGMRARESKSGAPESWYFITPLRVGIGFSLYDNNKRPRNESELAAQLGGQDEAVFDTAEHYRARLADELFGLSPQRLHSLVELLVILRRPKLSENLGVARLNEILSDGLPPVDAELVDGLAKNFDELKRDQEELQDFVRALDAVDEFLKGYRVYARGMTRHITGDVLDTADGHRKAVRESQRAVRSLAKVETEILDTEQKQDNEEKRQDELRGQIAALSRDPALETERDLERLKEEVDRATRVAETAQQQLNDAKRKHSDSQRHLNDVAKRLDTANAEVREAERITDGHAAGVGLQLEYRNEVAKLRDGSPSAQRTMQGYLDARRAAVGETRRLNRQQTDAQIELDKIQSTYDGLVARQNTAAQRVRELEGRHGVEVGRLSEAIVSWSGRCRQCRLTDDEVQGLVDAAGRIGEPDAPRLADLIGVHIDRVRGGLFDERSRVKAERATVAEVHETTAAERERVATEVDPAPTPVVARRDRTGLAGAPLWQLIDFGYDIVGSERAGLEAALLGAGLLDAWLTPDGSLLDSESWDVLLVAEPVPPGEGTTLSSVLFPVPQDEVPRSEVEAVLDSIWLADGWDDPPRPWVAADGRWSMGALRGHTGQDQASYIGVAAREAARQRRLAELDARLTELADQISALDSALTELDGRIGELANEQSDQPSDQSVREVVVDLVSARKQESQAQLEVNRLAGRLQSAKTVVSRATEAVRSYATANRMPVTETELEALDTELTNLQVAFERLANRISTAAQLAEREQQAREQVVELAETLVPLTDNLKENNATATTLRTEHEERTRLLGSSTREIHDQLNNARSQQRAAEKRSKELQDQQTDLVERRGGLKQRVESANGEVERLLAEHDAALTEFRRARRRGFLRLIEAPVPTAEASPAETTSADHTAEAELVYRFLAGEQSDAATRNEARNKVDNGFRALQGAIDGRDWQPWGDNDGELFVVQVTFNGGDHSVPGLRELIDGEIETRRTFVKDKERQLFTDVLLGSMGEHLRQRRLEAATLVRAMNDQLKAHETASAMRMQLNWKLAATADKQVSRAIELLDRGSTSFLAADARDALIAFLSERVEQARKVGELGDWKSHLRQALDYRHWSEFELLVKYPEKADYVPLTDGLHKQGSGGEKAVMLQLPLFAAAAAHYAGAAATAPRPIYLDEAFAGIDAEMRGSCIGLLTEFDLDFVMASHDEWGFHTTVPGLMTYQLFRDPAISCVLATPIVWDGARRHKLQDRALDPTAPPTILGEDQHEDEE